MKPTSIIQRLVILLITLMSAISANAQEAYACYTSSNTTLTFYYDNLRSTRTGTTYDLNSGDTDTDWDTDGTNSYVTKVVFDPSFANARPTTTYDWFYSMMDLQSIEGIQYLNTSEVTNMAWMFGYCTKLTRLDLSHFNTSKVNQMYDMFYNCTNLQTIYVGNGWSTAELSINSVSLFYKCTSIVGGKGTTYDANHVDADYAHIDGGPSNPGYFTTPPEAYACYTSSNTTLTFYYDVLRSSRKGTTFNLNSGGAVPAWYSNYTNASVTKVVFDPSFADARPTSTYDWFKDMLSLQTIEGMSYLNTSEVTTMSSMFYNCSKLTSLDLSSFNTAKVTSMGSMFWKCSNLQTIIVGDGWNTSAVSSSSNMFSYCSNLVGGQGTTYNGNYKDKTYAHIDGGTSNPGYFTAPPEAYACYTSSNTTLTFYYDGLRDSREGTTYNLNTGNNSPGWRISAIFNYVTKVVFDPSFANARPTTTYRWFYNMTNLQAIEGINYLNTSEVTNMAWMFYDCCRLTNIDLSSFNTSNVTNMVRMFSECSRLTSLDLSAFNTANVTGLNFMFAYSTNLRTIYVGDGWNTHAAESVQMFDYCTSLVGGKGTTYDANHVDGSYARIDGGTSNPGYFTANASRFYACYTTSNTTLTFYHDNYRSIREGKTYDLNTGSNLPGWFTDGYYSSVTKVVFDPTFASARPTSTFYWFMGMASLQSIEGMNYLNTSEVTNMSYMFTGCQLTSLNLINFNTSKVTDMTGMFDGSKLTTLDLSSFNTSEVTSMSTMFKDCSKLITIIVSDEWNTTKVTNSGSMFQNCTNLVGGQGTEYKPTYPTDKAYAHIDGRPSNPGYLTDINSLMPYACYTPENTTLTFYYDKLRGSRSGTIYDLNTGDDDPSWRTDDTRSKVTKVVFDPSFADARPTSTNEWFFYMKKLKTIEGISYLNTSEVTNMRYMFYACNLLTSLDLSSFNTAKVTDMSFMFYSCSNLASLVMSGFNTSKVSDMSYMFSNCYGLSVLDLSNFDTSKVTDMSYMFAGLTLTFLDLSSFDTSNVTNMEYMFYDCWVNELDLSSFNTFKVTNMDHMFASGISFQTIYVGEGWSTEAVTSSSNMFYNCTSLVGGQGTSYDANHVVADYAHIDGGDSNPGYFNDGSARQAYAVYTEENTTLTFYYDNKRSSRGTAYDMNTGARPEWLINGTNANVTKVVFDTSFAGARPTTTGNWFNGMRKLIIIEGMNYLNTNEVTNMFGMFVNCEQLTKLDLSSFNTSKVSNMNLLFSGCKKLRTIYVGNDWSMAAVTQSTNMFSNCTSLVGGQGTSYDANHVVADYAHIDGGPSNPGYFKESKIEAYAVYNEESTGLMFCYDNLRSSRLDTTYDLNSGNTPPQWFTDGTYDKVTEVVFSYTFAGARPTTTYAWFYGMTNLANITYMNNLNTSEVTNMNQMFYYCSNLKSLDISHFNTAKVTDMTDMFRECNNLRTIYVGDGWSTAAVTSSTNMFYKCNSLVGGKGTTFNDSNPKDKTYARIDGGASNPGYFTAESTMAYACYTPENTTLTFYYDNLWFSRTGISYFLNTGDNIPGWLNHVYNTNATKVVFDPSFAVARPTSTDAWFYDMENLETIEGMSYLNTSEVTDMAFMFRGCTRLTSIDLSSFNTSKVTNMRAMFAYCNSLKSLDLSSFNTSNVTIMGAMFSNSISLNAIYVGSDWSTAAVERSIQMFDNCYSLRGGQGTTYNASHIEADYAHIDGEGGPGYFTARTTGIATDLHQVTSDKSQVQSDEWYTIDGRKLNGMPAKKGVYIQNGQKRIIK